ncbi:Thermitase [Thauera sp. GDN1]|uniref:S8 family serine peptidase n=1 Tax=Thauera sp. GDN1 TaxID=2944810 RepID=UPI00247940A6|nr:S8 family serine peptidase [Thauera sp. GDN1]WEN43590.1 Thermitase [Thauera sp. GDN1]
MNIPATLHKPVLASLAVALGATFLPAQVSAADEAQWVPGRLLVQPRAGLPEAEFEKIVKQHGGKQVGKIEGIDVRVIQLPPQASEKAVEALLKKNKHLKFAERDMLIKPDATANDPYYGSAWHLSKIGVSSAWDVSTGRGATIAILDSGVDASHPDLAGKLVSGWNCYDNNSNTADVYGHGTAVAGTAAAATNNALGVAALAGEAMIMPMRITNLSGYGSWSAAAQCLTWAADRGANVANISFGGVSGSSTVQSAAQYLKNKGGLTVVAAGNSSGEELIAASSTMISVSATDSNDVKASWSSYGKYVDIAAPGTYIWTTTRGGSYQKWQGTSFASPVVAGVVALMKAANPALGAADLEKVLFSTVVDLGTTGWDAYYGHGRVNAAAAVKAVQTAKTSDTTAPSVGIGNPTAGSTVSGLVAVNVSATDNMGVSRVDLLVNGSKIASDTTAPYAFSWDSTKVADGSATLTAYAYDAAGNYASKSVSVTVANATAQKTQTTTDTLAPVATISNPAASSKVSGQVTVQGKATDDVGVRQMRLSIDGKLVASATSGSLSYRWNTNKLAAGSHTILLEAFDAAGNRGSKSITVTK